jgi:hypothetical protein
MSNKMKRYLVTGSMMEYIASLSCWAESETEAIRKWGEAFPDCSHFNVSATAVDELSREPGLFGGDPPYILADRMWGYSGRKFYSGGYQYNV